MSSAQIAKKIELLPEMLQLQVNDFVEFLLNLHFKETDQSPDDAEIAAKNKAELDNRYKDYLDNPNSVVSMENLKTRLMQKAAIF